MKMVRPDVLLDHNNGTNTITSTRKRHIQALKCPTRLNSTSGSMNNKKKNSSSSSRRVPSRKCVHSNDSRLDEYGDGDGDDEISSSLCTVCKRLKSSNNMYLRNGDGQEEEEVEEDGIYH